MVPSSRFIWYLKLWSLTFKKNLGEQGLFPLHKWKTLHTCLFAWKVVVPHYNEPQVRSWFFPGLLSSIFALWCFFFIKQFVPVIPYVWIEMCFPPFLKTNRLTVFMVLKKNIQYCIQNQSRTLWSSMRINPGQTVNRQLQYQHLLLWSDQASNSVFLSRQHSPSWALLWS